MIEGFELRLGSDRSRSKAASRSSPPAAPTSRISTQTSSTSRTASPTATLLQHDLVDADTYLVELKAAAIDVVAEHALARGIRVVLAANEVVGDFDDRLLALAPEAAKP